MITALTIIALILLALISLPVVLSGVLLAAATPLTIWPSVAICLAAGILLSSTK